MTVPPWWARRRPQLPPPGARVVGYGTIYGTSVDNPRGSLAEHMAEDFLSMRAAELADKRLVTLRFESVGFFGRRMGLRPTLREINRRLEPQGYVLTGRDRYSRTWTHVR